MRSGEVVAGDDDLLQGWIRRHADPLREVSRIIEDEMGHPNTPRLKTRNTLVEKLRRENTNLLNMDDVAGIRLDSTGIRSRSHQDEIRDALLDRFPDHKPVKDRRADPRYGYRAVHVVVRHEGFLVEVQVRTEMQHQWAEVTEKLGDIIGRGLRYGDMPEDPIAAQLHLTLLGLADNVDRVEQVGLLAEETEEAVFASLHPDELDLPETQGRRKEFDDLAASLDDLRQNLKAIIAEVRDDVVEFEKRQGDDK